MKRLFRNALFLSLLTLAAGAASPAEAAEARKITLQECIEIAMRQNPDVLGAMYDIDAAEAARLSARGNYGPKLRTEAGVQVWDKAVTMDFGSLMTPLMNWIMSFAPPSAIAAAQNGALGSNDPLQVRGQVTWNAGVTLAQPIASLWTIDEAAKLRAIGVDVAKINSETTRRNTAYQVIEGYYRVLQAERIRDVAAKSVEQIESQVKRAEAFYRQGTVGKNDVLRAKLGFDAARSKLIGATGTVSLAQARLATLLGLSTDAAVEPAIAPEGAPPRTVLSLEQAESLAASRRLELQTVAASIRMAERNVSLSKSKMMPQINALANYSHNEGSAFQPKDSVFVGGSLSWDIWENGATYYGIAEAKAKLAQAHTVQKKTEDGLRLEARNAFITTNTAAEALVVAQSAVTQAEENYRIESKRYEAANNTSFDVLDAETLLTNARAQYQAALYDYIIAQSALARAIGEVPSEPKTGHAVPADPAPAPAGAATPSGGRVNTGSSAAGNAAVSGAGNAASSGAAGTGSSAAGNAAVSGAGNAASSGAANTGSSGVGNAAVSGAGSATVSGAGSAAHAGPVTPSTAAARSSGTGVAPTESGGPTNAKVSGNTK